MDCCVWATVWVTVCGWHYVACGVFISVTRHGKAVMECVPETARRAASWKDVMESDTGGASRNSRHGMRNEKH